jgi:hypothetical protein
MDWYILAKILLLCFAALVIWVVQTVEEAKVIWRESEEIDTPEELKDPNRANE